jgi:hypothetical protein
MIVALHITSESGDHYLNLYKDKSVQEIHDELMQASECYYGCNIDFEVLDASIGEAAELAQMLSDFEEESWNFD